MLSKDQLKEILLEQRKVILKKPLGIERTIIKKIETKIKIPSVVIITGLRRSGKSTTLRQVIKKRYNDEDFYYINFEDERLFNFKAQDFNIIYEAFIELFGQKNTFFIDEIQNVPLFENFVRRFHDDGFKLFITGSNANLLSREFGTKLTGRHTDILVEPFSFREFLTLKKLEINKNSVYLTKERVKIKKLFLEYLSSGGMPEYAIFQDPEYLMRIYEDIIIKDIVIRYNIDNHKELKELYQYLVTTISQRFSYSSLKKFAKINSSTTIKKYIDFLEDTHFINIINKFDYSLRKRMMNDKKAYVIDNGFVQKIAIKFTKDKDWLLENLVFNSLKKQGEIFYFSEKNECDFIIRKMNKILASIQVCWDLNQNNRDREINGLKEAMDKFKLKDGLILTYDQDEEIKVGNKKIIVKPVWKWLLEDNF